MLCSGKEVSLIKGILAIFAILFMSVPCLAEESISDWVKERPGIKWDASPLDYPKQISSKDSILWVGRIEDINVYINDQKETVIEFLCRHLTLVKSGPTGVAEPLQVKDRETGFFVITIRSPELPFEKASELREENKKTRHFAVALGEPVDRRFFSVERSAVYVHSVKAMMSDTLRVNIIK
jgi:hypothetical protein